MNSFQANPFLQNNFFSDARQSLRKFFNKKCLIDILGEKGVITYVIPRVGTLLM